VSTSESERRSRLSSTAGRVLVPEVARLIDRGLAGPLPEELVQSAVRHRVIERVAAELVRSGALDRAVTEALESPHTTELTNRIVHSDQMRQAIREVVESPEMRAALARQTTGLAEELVGSIRTRAVELDDRLERGSRVSPSPYAGIATRAVALAIDAGAVILIYVSLSAMVGLISTLVGTLRPAWLVGILLGSGFALVAGTYFVLFWSGAGQTPGMRLLHLRLQGDTGRPPSFGWAVLRAIGTVIAIIPLFAGYLPVLFDDRRRGLPDFLARTIVVYESPIRKGPPS
jgi:uncharacterized RDD family membrane protein YckC